MPSEGYDGAFRAARVIHGHSRVTRDGFPLLSTRAKGAAQALAPYDWASLPAVHGEAGAPEYGNAGLRQSRNSYKQSLMLRCRLPVFNGFWRWVVNCLPSKRRLNGLSFTARNTPTHCDRQVKVEGGK